MTTADLQILIIGGSNSVLSPGYTSHLPAALSFAGIKAKIENHAVGANTCLHGAGVVGNIDLSDFNVVLIDYAINDFDMVVDFGIETWQAAYEGLIRGIRRRAPRALVVPLVLGRQDDKAVPVQEKMRACLQSLRDPYRLTIIDFDSFLRATLPRGQFQNAYMDLAHYRRPNTSTLLAQFVALALAGAVKDEDSWFHSLEAPRGLPEPILSAKPFDPVQRVIAAKTLPPDLERLTFQNSRYAIEVVRLPADRKVTLPSRGRLLCFEVASTSDSCEMEVSVPQIGTLHLSTLHPMVADGTFPFLLKSLILPVPYRGPVTVRAVANPKSLADTQTVRNRPMVSNTADEGLAIYLLSWIEF